MYLIQTLELSRRIRDAEKDVQRLVTEEYVVQPSPTDPEAQQGDAYGPDAGSDDDDDDDDGGHQESEAESFDALESRFHGLEEEVATLVADVHDLALYTKLNITGFMKILKVRSFSILVYQRLTNLHLHRNMMYTHSCHIILSSVVDPSIYRNKPICTSRRPSFRTISNGAPSISTTGML